MWVRPAEKVPVGTAGGFPQRGPARCVLVALTALTACAAPTEVIDLSRPPRRLGTLCSVCRSCRSACLAPPASPRWADLRVWLRVLRIRGSDRCGPAASDQSAAHAGDGRDGCAHRTSRYRPLLHGLQRHGERYSSCGVGRPPTLGESPVMGVPCTRSFVLLPTLF